MSSFQQIEMVPYCMGELYHICFAVIEETGIETEIEIGTEIGIVSIQGVLDLDQRTGMNKTLLINPD